MTKTRQTTKTDGFDNDTNMVSFSKREIQTEGARTQLKINLIFQNKFVGRNQET